MGRIFFTSQILFSFQRLNVLRGLCITACIMSDDLSLCLYPRQRLVHASSCSSPSLTPLRPCPLSLSRAHALPRHRAYMHIQCVRIPLSFSRTRKHAHATCQGREPFSHDGGTLLMQDLAYEDLLVRQISAKYPKKSVMCKK